MYHTLYQLVKIPLRHHHRQQAPYRLEERNHVLLRQELRMPEAQYLHDVYGHLLHLDQGLGVAWLIPQQHVVDGRTPDAEGLLEVLWPFVHRIQWEVELEGLQDRFEDEGLLVLGESGLLEIGDWLLDGLCEGWAEGFEGVVDLSVEGVWPRHVPDLLEYWLHGSEEAVCGLGVSLLKAFGDFWQ